MQSDKKVWFTADTHFGHANVMRYCNRPFKDKYQMDQVMIERWNVRVGINDTVYHLGDFSFYGSTETTKIASKLNGYKILIRGNHDKGKDYYLRIGFKEYYQSTAQNPVHFKNFLISHYPYLEIYDHDERRQKFEDRMFTKQGNVWLLCGHIHEKWKSKGRCINVGVDQWNFAPVGFDEILAYQNELINDRTHNHIS